MIRSRRLARGHVLAGGLAVAVAYLAGAAVSGHLSPMARRPILDGFASAPPYRWVSPPPGFVSGNEAPTDGSLTVQLHPNGSAGGAVSTRDLQVTVILKDGAFTQQPGATGVDVVVEPFAPATLGAPYGFDGIAIALIGQTHPLGVGAAALLFGVLRAGGTRMQLLGVHKSFPELIQGLALLFVAGKLIWERMLQRLERRRGTG